LKVKVNFGGLRAVYVWKNIFALVFLLVRFYMDGVVSSLDDCGALLKRLLKPSEVPGINEASSAVSTSAVSAATQQQFAYDQQGDVPVKAKFHYASWFGAGSEPVRSRFGAGSS